MKTPLAYVDLPDLDDQAGAIAAPIPLRRIGEPEDLAAPVGPLIADHY